MNHHRLGLLRFETTHECKIYYLISLTYRHQKYESHSHRYRCCILPTEGRLQHIRLQVPKARITTLNDYSASRWFIHPQAEMYEVRIFNWDTSQFSGRSECTTVLCALMYGVLAKGGGLFFNERY